MLVLSCLTAWASATASQILETDSLSPVNSAWSILKDPEEMESRRASAGIRFPTEMRIMSPGTTSAAGTFDGRPSRITFASSGEYFMRA